MAKYTLEDAKNQIKRAIEIKGADFKYHEGYKMDDNEACRYTIDGQPACIVGVALTEAGVADLRTLYAVDVSEHTLFQENWADDYEEDAVIFMQTVQNAQDAGKTWGEAYRIGKAVVGRSEDRALDPTEIKYHGALVSAID